MKTAPQPVITPLFTEQAIARQVDILAEAIAKHYAEDLLIVALLKGSFIFAADLIRALHRKGKTPQVDFMTISSYGNKTESSGALTIHRDIAEAVEGRHILLVDDILETGRTLTYAYQEMVDRNAAEVRVAVLLDKPGKTITDINADFVGFTVESNQFVVGYGLDYANYYRELPYIGYITT